VAEAGHGPPSATAAAALQLDPPRLSGPGLETPSARPPGQAARFSIGSTPPEARASSSPWWGAGEYGTEDNGAGAPSELPALVAAALRPLLSDLRQELLREVHDSQVALLEQAFRLHADLRRDVEELRSEVQLLRGELRVL